LTIFYDIFDMHAIYTRNCQMCHCIYSKSYFTDNDIDMVNIWHIRSR